MPTVSLRRRVYFEIVKDLLGAYFKLYHHWQVEGAKYIPDHGPLFIVINHLSFLEPFALGAALVARGIFPGTHFWTVSKKELFRFRPAAALWKTFAWFPIDRARTDLGAMRTMLNILGSGKMIAVAPEGTRSPTGQLQAFQPVIAKIAISRRIPILPVGASGSEKAMPVGSKFPRPRPITIRFGPIFELSEFYDITLTEELADRASWVMRAHIAELLPAWMRQVPPPSGRIGERKK